VNQPRRTTLRAALAVSALALLASACIPITAPPPTPPPPPPGSPTLTFNKSFVTNVAQPWDIAFAPDGTMLYTEKGGALWSFAAGGIKKQLGTVTGSTINGEGGLMGLAVDPNFASNQFVYVCTTTAVPDNRIVRLTLNLAAAAGAGITAQTPVVTGMTRAGVHNGCRVRFQPGTSDLFWSMGDAAGATLPQDLSSMNGKILRGQVTNGNVAPHPNNPNPATYVFTYGHRNPQGLAFNPNLSNTPYSVEHGSNVDDEVNKLVVGANAGRDPNNGAGGYDDSQPMTDFVKFPSAIAPVWKSANNRTIAPSGATFIQNLAGMNWGSWNGALILAVLKDSELRLLMLKADGTLASESQVAGSTGIRLRSVVQSPVDGRLYVAEDRSPGQIWQITPS